MTALGHGSPTGHDGAATVLTPTDVEAVAARVVELQAERDRPVRLALSVTEACEALGVGWDFWSAHIAPEVRVVRRGARKLVPVAELERWLEASAERVLPGPRLARTSRFAGTSREAGAPTPVARGEAA